MSNLVDAKTAANIALNSNAFMQTMLSINRDIVKASESGLFFIEIGIDAFGCEKDYSAICDALKSKGFHADIGKIRSGSGMHDRTFLSVKWDANG